VKQAEHKIQLEYLPRHTGTDENETTDELTKQGSSYPLIRHQPACGVSAKVARRVIKDWTSGKQGASIHTWTKAH